MRGIFFNQKHSWYAFRAVISASEKPVPEKKLAEESVPFSNVTYDFSALNGKQTYQDRILKYQFSILANSARHIERKAVAFMNWLYEPAEKIILKDDSEPDYHYLAKCTEISTPEFIGNVCILTATFKAYPFRIPDGGTAYKTEETRFPDLNQNDRVDAGDTALILSAVAHIGAGEPSGLTEEQEYLADVNMDGSITAQDVALVQSFVAQAGAGNYENSPDGWTKYLNFRLGLKEEIL